MAGLTGPQTAGRLRERLHLQRRAPDANGDRLGPWSEAETVITCRARIQPLRGGETVMAARLQGEAWVQIAVRSSNATRQVDDTFRAVDARDPARVFEIRSALDDEKRVWVTILAVQRVEQTQGG